MGRNNSGSGQRSAGGEGGVTKGTCVGTSTKVVSLRVCVGGGYRDDGSGAQSQEGVGKHVANGLNQ